MRRRVVAGQDLVERIDWAEVEVGLPAEVAADLVHVAVERLEHELQALEQRVERAESPAKCVRTNSSKASASPSSARQNCATCLMPRSMRARWASPYFVRRARSRDFVIVSFMASGEPPSGARPGGAPGERGDQDEQGDMLLRAGESTWCPPAAESSRNLSAPELRTNFGTGDTKRASCVSTDVARCSCRGLFLPLLGAPRPRPRPDPAPPACASRQTARPRATASTSDDRSGEADVPRLGRHRQRLDEKTELLWLHGDGLEDREGRPPRAGGGRASPSGSFREARSSSGFAFERPLPAGGDRRCTWSTRADRRDLHAGRLPAEGRRRLVRLHASSSRPTRAARSRASTSRPTRCPGS